MATMRKSGINFAGACFLIISSTYAWMTPIRPSLQSSLMMVGTPSTLRRASTPKLGSITRSVALRSTTTATTGGTDTTNDKTLEGLRVGIAGAGPSGLLLAHRLLKAGATKCTIYESRKDPRKEGVGLEGRAYALGLGIRGRTAIRTVNEQLWQDVKNVGFQSERFDLHLSPKLKFRLRDEKLSVGKNGERLEPSLLLYQSDLCSALLNSLESQYNSDRLEVKFTSKVFDIDFDNQRILQTIRYSDKETWDGPYDLIVGCDGVNSVVRTSMERSIDGFDVKQERLPGIFKVARLPIMPPLLDPTSIHLVAGAAGTAFVEPTAAGQCCILFNGKLADNSSNKDDETIIDSFQDLVREQKKLNEDEYNLSQIVSDFEMQYPLLEGLNGTDVVLQLADQSPSNASAVKCNIYHGCGFVALVGDAAHATGGVTGQGCNSALMDSVSLANCLEQAFKEEESTRGLSKSEIISKALMQYSKSQVPEGLALYDLAFGAKEDDNTKIGPLLNLRIKIGTLLDTLFGGKFGLGKPLLQTLATTTLTPFSDIRRDRSSRYPNQFPTKQQFHQQIETLSLNQSLRSRNQQQVQSGNKEVVSST